MIMEFVVILVVFCFCLGVFSGRWKQGEMLGGEMLMFTEIVAWVMR